MGSYPYPRNGIVEIDYEFILLFKKSGKSPRPSPETKEKSKLTKEEWKTYFSGHWYFNGERQDKHLAMFPEELPRRVLKMFTFVGDTVLDPFLGSGTTTLATKNTGRNSIGYEINENFLPVINKKLDIDKKDLFETAHFEIIRQPVRKADWNEEIAKLPYQFKDPVRFERKIDPKKLQFGSKIDAIKQGKNKFFSVKKILSPELIQLNTGITIRLIGITEIPTKREQAIRFLQDKTKGQKVFLKFDSTKFDRNNNLLCYLYLKNKTFVNAHLIKNSLVDIDTQSEYKYKKRFLGYLVGQVNG